MERAVADIVGLLVAQQSISVEDGNTYMCLWRLLGLYRQDAARRLLVSACTWQNNAQLAVDHIHTVLSQNVQAG